MVVVFWKPFFLFFATKYKDLTNNLEVLVQVKVFFLSPEKKELRIMWVGMHRLFNFLLKHFLTLCD
jgi:hypothetical protein